jgi:hypothetical protein
MIADVELIQIISELGSDAYTGSISRAVRSKTNESVQVGWLHMRINRLKSGGLLQQEKGSEIANGNRPKSFVRLTPKGQEIARLRNEPGRANALLRSALQ